MEFRPVLLLSFWAAVANADMGDLQLEADQPLVRVLESHEATIRCCYRWSEKPHVIWIMNSQIAKGATVPRIVNETDIVKIKPVVEENGVKCHSLVFSSVHVEHIGLYQCKLNNTAVNIFTHGTFLQVYKRLQKTLDISESKKNSIITAEGVLLLMLVLIPGTMLLCKSKSLNELERKKGREEENIYEGLNLDDCNSAYHQIQRSSQQGPYQDVAARGEDIQLEKP